MMLIEARPANPNAERNLAPYHVHGWAINPDHIVSVAYLNDPTRSGGPFYRARLINGEVFDIPDEEMEKLIA